MLLYKKLLLMTFGTTLVLLKVYDILQLFIPVALRPNAGHDLLILEASKSDTTEHHTQ